MNERAKELAELGRRVYGELNSQTRPMVGQAECLIEAIAAMLAAPAAPKKAKAKKELNLPFSPQALHAALAAQCGDKVVCFPYQHSTFGSLGRELKDISDLEFADLERLCAWVNAGGLNWVKGALSFAAFTKLIGKSVALAREWDKRGRQNLRGGNNVGTSTAQEDVGSSFK